VNQARTIVLDNEAVQALADPDHGKHRRVLAAIEAAASRNLRRAGSVSLVVPTAVQVEAGWDRKQPRAAALNRLRAERPALAGDIADNAAEVASTTGVSVADAHLVATLASTPGPHAVITSDEPDVLRGADHVGITVTVVRI
jgi:predicted nucleic acid-binding protein